MRKSDLNESRTEKAKYRDYAIRRIKNAMQKALEKSEAEKPTDGKAKNKRLSPPYVHETYENRRKCRTKRAEGQNFRPAAAWRESREFYSRLSAVQNVDTLPSPYATESLSAYKFFVDRYLLSLHRFPALQNGDVFDRRTARALAFRKHFSRYKISTPPALHAARTSLPQ